MPIEIRELHIRVTVNPPTQTNAQSAPPTPAAGTGAADREAIVAECVEQVMELLAQKRER